MRNWHLLRGRPRESVRAIAVLFCNRSQGVGDRLLDVGFLNRKKAIPFFDLYKFVERHHIDRSKRLDSGSQFVESLFCRGKIKVIRYLPEGKACVAFIFVASISSSPRASWGSGSDYYRRA